MSGRDSRNNLFSLRERYLWLWRHMQKLDSKLRNVPAPANDPPRRDLWAQRMKQQLKRYWP